jgi:hypothetical protein
VGVGPYAILFKAITSGGGKGSFQYTDVSNGISYRLAVGEIQEKRTEKYYLSACKNLSVTYEFNF